MYIYIHIPKYIYTITIKCNFQLLHAQTIYFLDVKQPSWQFKHIPISPPPPLPSLPQPLQLFTYKHTYICSIYIFWVFVGILIPRCMANQKIMPTAKERKKNYTQNINKNNKKIIKESFFFFVLYTLIHINYTPMQSQSVKCFVVVPKDNKTRKQLQQWKIRKFGSFFFWIL